MPQPCPFNASDPAPAMLQTLPLQCPSPAPSMPQPCPFNASDPAIALPLQCLSPAPVLIPSPTRLWVLTAHPAEPGSGGGGGRRRGGRAASPDSPFSTTRPRQECSRTADPQRGTAGDGRATNIHGNSTAARGADAPSARDGGGGSDFSQSSSPYAEGDGEAATTRLPPPPGARPRSYAALTRRHIGRVAGRGSSASSLPPSSAAPSTSLSSPAPGPSAAGGGRDPRRPSGSSGRSPTAHKSHIWPANAAVRVTAVVRCHACRHRHDCRRRHACRRSRSFVVLQGAVRLFCSLFDCFACCSAVLLAVRLFCSLFGCFARCSAVLLAVRLFCSLPS